MENESPIDEGLVRGYNVQDLDAPPLSPNRYSVMTYGTVYSVPSLDNKTEFKQPSPPGAFQEEVKERKRGRSGHSSEREGSSSARKYSADSSPSGRALQPRYSGDSFLAQPLGLIEEDSSASQWKPQPRRHASSLPSSPRDRPRGSQQSPRSTTSSSRSLPPSPLGSRNASHRTQQQPESLALFRSSGTYQFFSQPDLKRHPLEPIPHSDFDSYPTETEPTSQDYQTHAHPPLHQPQFQPQHPPPYYSHHQSQPTSPSQSQYTQHPLVQPQQPQPQAQTQPQQTVTNQRVQTRRSPRTKPDVQPNFEYLPLRQTASFEISNRSTQTVQEHPPFQRNESSFSYHPQQSTVQKEQEQNHIHTQNPHSPQHYGHFSIQGHHSAPELQTSPIYYQQSSIYTQSHPPSQLHFQSRSPQSHPQSPPQSHPQFQPQSHLQFHLQSLPQPQSLSQTFTYPPHTHVQYHPQAPPPDHGHGAPHVQTPQNTQPYILQAELAIQQPTATGSELDELLDPLFHINLYQGDDMAISFDPVGEEMVLSLTEQPFVPQ